jgi:hypothetical protein
MAAQPAQLELAPQATNGFALMRLARRAKLPSGLNTVSSAALLNHLLAVDSAGSVFLSQDGGKRWEMVKPQWSGKAITVHAPAQNGHQLLTGTAAREDSTAVSGNSQKAPAEDGRAVNAPAPPPPADANAASPAENATLISTAAPGPPNLLFKLVTDRREVWVSLDGKVWRKQ